MLKLCPSVGLWVPGPGRFRVQSADFDGADSMVRGGNLTGIADSKSGILSAWARFDGGDSSTQTILHGTGVDGDEGIWVAKGPSGGNALVVMDNTGSGVSFSLFGLTDITAGATWHHILAAWNGATGAKHFYLDGVDDLDPGSTANNVDTEYTDCTQWIVGDDGFSEFMNGCLAELYFAPGQYLDLSVADNRAKFRDSGGRPLDLGATGALPTGVAPLVYQSLRANDLVAAFLTNRGTGGNFSMSGGDALAIGSSSPTD